MVILFVKPFMTKISASFVDLILAIWTLSHEMIFLFSSCDKLFSVGPHIGYSLYDKILLFSSLIR